MSWRTRHYPNIYLRSSPKKLRKNFSFHPNIYKSSPVLRFERTSFFYVLKSFKFKKQKNIIFRQKDTWRTQNWWRFWYNNKCLEEQDTTLIYIYEVPPKKLRKILSFHPNIYKSSPVLRFERTSFFIFIQSEFNG